MVGEPVTDCPNCNAEMTVDPATINLVSQGGGGKMSCPKCGEDFELKEENIIQ